VAKRFFLKVSGMDRNEEMTRIRPNLNGIPKTADEAQLFFSHTLKPVLKLQTPVLLAYMKGFAERKSKHFSIYKTAEKVRFLKVLLRENDRLHQGIYGILNGVMTLTEVEQFNGLSEKLERIVMREVEAVVEKNTVML
jgi:hypothetical protein